MLEINNMTDFQLISNCIKNEMAKGCREFAIFPFGEKGVQIKNILETQFGIREVTKIDNILCKYNEDIFSVDEILSKTDKKFTLLFSCENPEIRDELLSNISKCNCNIIDIFGFKFEKETAWRSSLPKTKKGKYSYGPLCDHLYVEKVGAFCSFANGCDVVPNHAVNYISTHPFLTHDNTKWEGFMPYELCKGHYDWYFEDVKPKGDIDRRRIEIGNDVWLGKDVLITNYANIGDGVIAGAGSVITKDVPDYAVVAGVPARIIRYRYTKEQINELKKIAWWNWPDEKIRDYYDDFFDDIDVFINKHK